MGERNWFLGEFSLKKIIPFEKLSVEGLRGIPVHKIRYGFV